MLLSINVKKDKDFFDRGKPISTQFLMKFSIFILLVGIFIPTAKGFSQRINLHVKQKKIERVFRQIEQASGYSFFYDKDLIKGAPLIDLSLENTPIAKALDIVLQNTGLSYTIHNKYIVIASTGKINTEEKQPTQISGTIVDTADRPIPAVSILNKRNKKTSKSNEAGQFSIEAMPNDVLLFSFVGFERQEIQLTNLIPLKVVLKTETGVLDQVVVTALGIKKSSRELSYNIQELKKEELTTVPDASLVNSLSGKVAGVTINASASGIGGSTRVVMRGDKSIFGNNNALYVLDGMPLPNLFSKNSITPNGIYGGRDGGDGISNLNPEDFESVSVLTGAASAALYGSQAANGVILLTTKKGNKERTNIGISNSSTFFSPFVMPEFQNTYGTSTPGAFDSWGSKLSTPSSFNVKDFFETGSNISNTISLSTGSEKNQTYLSIASLNGRGIIPKNKMDRYNITLNNSTSFLDNKLSLDLNLMFVKLKNQNMISQGQYFNPIVPLYLFPRGDDIEKYKVYERYNPERNFKTQFWPYGPLGLSMQNPYWTTNRNFNNNDRERYVMGATLKYQVNNWLQFSGRVRADNSTNLNEVRNFASTLPLLAGNSNNGSYLNANDKTRQTYADVLGTITDNFGDIGLNFNLGTSFLRTNYQITANSLDANGAGLATVPNLFSLSNVTPSPNLQERYTEETQAIFANAQLNYKNGLYLDVTGRNEWSSPLANTRKKSFFYPSVGLSFILNEWVPINPGVLSFAKLRGSYSEVGNTLPRFISQESYPVNPNGVSVNPNLALTDLKPERTKAIEAGINTKFLHNKISFDVTLYQSDTYNQLFRFAAPDGSGVSNYYVNAGKVRNKGIEASLGGNIQIGPLLWQPSAIFTLNRNRIEKLVENYINPVTGVPFTSNRFDMGGIGSYRNYIEKGGSFGDIYVNKLETDAHGYILVNPTTGALSVDNVNLLKAGNTNPRFNVGFRNSFQYKQFNLGFLIDGRFGGVMVSSTQALMDGYGTSAASEKARDNGGVEINGQMYDAKRYYETVGLGTGVLSRYVYSATNIRLREASLAYTFPSALFNNRIKSITASVIGRNLFMFYNKAPSDPETTASTGTYFQGIDYFMLPSLRSIGFSLRVNL